MNEKKSVFFTSVLCLFCSVSGYSTPLEEEIKGYQDAIKKAHESVDALKKVNERFKGLSFGEKEEFHDELKTLKKTCFNIWNATKELLGSFVS